MSTRSSPVTRGSASASLSPSSDHSALVQRFDALSAQVDNLTSNLQTLVTTLSSRGVPISPLAGNPPSDPPPASPDTPASVSFSDSIPSQPDPVAPSPPTAAIPGSFTPPAFDQPQPLPSQPSASSDESRLSLVPLFLGPVFDPRHPPDDSIFLAYSWFCPYFAEQVSLHFNADLTIDSSVASCLHPFARIISVTAYYFLPASWPSLTRIQPFIDQAASNLLHSLFADIRAFVFEYRGLRPLHAYIIAAVSSLRASHPYIVSHRTRRPDIPPPPDNTPPADGTSQPAAPAAPRQPSSYARGRRRRPGGL